MRKTTDQIMYDRLHVNGDEFNIPALHNDYYEIVDDNRAFVARIPLDAGIGCVGTIRRARLLAAAPLLLATLEAVRENLKNRTDGVHALTYEVALMDRVIAIAEGRIKYNDGDEQ